jgi:putative phosphoesterase
MLIGVMSDTHDNVLSTRNAVAELNREGVELVLHAGDVIAPFMISTLKDLKPEMIGVFGNNDGDRELLQKKCAGFPHLSFRGNFARLFLEGSSVGLIHGSDTDLLDALITGGAFDIVVFGHSHSAEIRTVGKTLSVNPGEVCGYLSGTSTVAIVDTKSRHAEIITLH